MLLAELVLHSHSQTHTMCHDVNIMYSIVKCLIHMFTLNMPFFPHRVNITSPIVYRKEKKAKSGKLFKYAVKIS